VPAAPAIRLLEPAAGVLGFYAGRDGSRFAAEPNWVDEGAIGLGIASYALLAGDDALVYDSGISVEWGRLVRDELERRGARRLTVVLSHWHLDHVADTEVFGDCEVLANERTAAHLARRREAIEAGELEGPPAIAPLVLPTRTFAERETLRLGSGEEEVAVELLALDIHSDDATVLWLPSGACCSAATRWRTPSLTSTSRSASTPTCATSAGSASWRRGRSSPTTATPRRSPPAATRRR
jgi:cyclase